MSSSRNIGAVAAGVGILIGLILGHLLRANDSGETNEPASLSAPTQPSPDPTFSAELAVLREILAIEREARIELAEDLDLLWEEFENLMQQEHIKPEGALEAAAADKNPNEEKPWFDVNRVQQNGLSEEEAERLRGLFDANVLKKLYLRETATREGWAASTRYRDEIRTLQDSFRKDLGDEDYDWSLFASGRENRALVDTVLRDSPAEGAGLLAGDVIWSYDSERVFTPRELRNHTLRSARNASPHTIILQVVRGGEIIDLYVREGALGASLSPTKRVPF